MKPDRGIAVAIIVVIALGFAAWLVLIPGPDGFRQRLDGRAGGL